MGDEKFLLLSGIELGFPGYPAHSLVTVLTELSRLPVMTTAMMMTMMIKESASIMAISRLNTEVENSFRNSYMLDSGLLKQWTVSSLVFGVCHD
jgi:predicted metal-binding membrane protein